MAAAPIGTEVGLTYDWTGPEEHAPQEGQFLRTPAGRCYLIVSMRRVRTKAVPCRFAIRALVIEEADVLNDLNTPVYDLAWNRRGWSGGAAPPVRT